VKFYSTQRQHMWEIEKRNEDDRRRKRRERQQEADFKRFIEHESKEDVWKLPNVSNVSATK